MTLQPAGSARPRVLLAIPCYNEGASIEPLLLEIRALNRGYDTVVVDDGSSDDTYAKAMRLSPCLKLVCNLGIGGAVQTAIKYARENDYDFCVQVDGDAQHPPDQVEALLESYAKSPANVVIGSRFLAEGEFKSTWARRIGIGVICGVIRFFYGKTFTDPTSGLRLLDRRAIALFSEEYPHDFPEPISLAEALERRLSVREVSVRMRSREAGESSISGFKIMAYMIRVVGYIILVRMGRHM